MAFCVNCGAEIVDGAKFCQKCGHPVASIKAESTSRQQEFVGKIYKCPNCGEPLKSFVATCPACGLELRGAKATSAVREFALKLEAIEAHRETEKPTGIFKKAEQDQKISKTDEQKINLIKNFSVPNTKEDILEFMILATSNVDTSIYASTDTLPAKTKVVTEAWMSKVKQVYSKAKNVYGSDADFQRIQELYDSCYAEIGTQKKKKYLKYVLMFGWLPLMLAIFIIGSNISEPTREAEEIARLEAIVTDIQQALEKGEYKYALMSADSIDYQRYDIEMERKWDIERIYWIDKVLEEASKNGIVIDYTVSLDNSDIDKANNSDSSTNAKESKSPSGFIEGFQEELQPGLDKAKEAIDEFSDTMSKIQGEGDKSEANIVAEPTAPIPSPDEIDYADFRIAQGSEYTCMTDKWNLYLATAISDEVIKIENWERRFATNKAVDYDYDVGSYKITDSENGFSWIDEDHTAFTFSLLDKNDGSIFPKPTQVVFTINISEDDTNKGSNYEASKPCYVYINDDWNIYRAFHLADNIIKIENWYRHFKVGNFYYGYDVYVIDLMNTDTDFKWADEEHSAFTITMQDNENSNLKEPIFVSFVKE